MTPRDELNAAFKKLVAEYTAKHTTHNKLDPGITTVDTDARDLDIAKVLNHAAIHCQQAVAARHGSMIGDTDYVREAHHVSRALYDKLYDDAEYYQTNLAAITVWRLRIATNQQPTSSRPPVPRRERELKPRAAGKCGRTVFLVWDSTTGRKMVDERMRLKALHGSVPSTVKYAADLLYQQYGLKE